MAPTTPNGPDLIFPARGLSLAGLVLAALYLSILAGSLFPIQLLNPAWQLSFGSALINASPFPLIGLGALHLASALDPEDALLRRRSRLAARLAVGVALGFLLLIPLLSLAAINDQQLRASRQSNRIASANANLRALRQVVAQASSGRELHDRLIALNGPVLDAADQALPLPTIKARVNGLLDQAAAQVARQKQQPLPSNPLSLMPGLLRNAFASLALALGFAGLAQRRGSAVSFLEELEETLFPLRQRSSTSSGEPDWSTDEDQYLRLISDGADDEPPSGAGD